MPRSPYPEDHTDSRSVTRRWCSGCQEWKICDNSNFQRMKDKRWKGKPSEEYWSRRCRECLRDRDYIKHGHYHSLSKYRKHLDWMIGVVGWNETWKRIGVSRTSLYYWLGGKKPDGKTVRRISTPSAKRIITAAAVLREEVRIGSIVPISDHHASGHCRGCGSDLHLVTYTEGCEICWDRRRSRERRKTKEYQQYERDRNKRLRNAVAA